MCPVLSTFPPRIDWVIRPLSATRSFETPLSCKSMIFPVPVELTKRALEELPVAAETTSNEFLVPVSAWFTLSANAESEPEEDGLVIIIES